MTKLIIISLCLKILVGGVHGQVSPRPLGSAHAHNDYEHTRPLLDALDHGFCSVEADVWLVDGRLLVAHDRQNVKQERTLEALYLDPLKARIEQNGGRVFRGGPSVTLLIDVKSDATNTYLALQKVLKRYEPVLTKFHKERTETNAVTVIISGNRARALMAGESVRLAAYDGRLSDLDSGDSQHFIPLVSDNWSSHFRWRATASEGPLPALERQKLKGIVDRAHQQGRRLRWWGAPDTPSAWKELAEAKVDLINTDNLDGLQKFLAPATARD